MLLNDLGDHARERGWSVIDITAGPDMLADLHYGLEAPAEAESGSVGINVGVASANVAVKKRELSLRDQMPSCVRAGERSARDDR